MGTATLDLPDPLQVPPVGAASTDDLLAQMAGEQIERLLAEADASPKTAASSPLTAAESPSPIAEAQPAPTAPSPSPADSHPAAANPEPPADLNSVLTEIATSAPVPATKTEPVATAPHAQGSAAPPSAPKDPEASAADALAREIMEDEALTAAARAGLAMASNKSPEGEATVGVKSPASPVHVSLPVRLLELLNAPLSSCSDRTRELIGKIAILTTVNALSVIAYVLFLRHR